MNLPLWIQSGGMKTNEVVPPQHKRAGSAVRGVSLMEPEQQEHPGWAEEEQIRVCSSEGSFRMCNIHGRSAAVCPGAKVFVETVQLQQRFGGDRRSSQKLRHADEQLP